MKTKPHRPAHGRPHKEVSMICKFVEGHKLLHAYVIHIVATAYKMIVREVQLKHTG